MPEMTQQEALKLAREKFGHTAYIEDSVNYRLVGVKPLRGKKTFAVGDTWEEAMSELESSLARKGKRAR